MDQSTLNAIRDDVKQVGRGFGRRVGDKIMRIPPEEIIMFDADGAVVSGELGRAPKVTRNAVCAYMKAL